MSSVILASSAKAEEVEHYLDLLEARELVDGWTSAGDVERTKPEPDLVEAALEKVGGGGPAADGRRLDWDVGRERGGVPTLAVLTGGFSAAELREAGAVDVVAEVSQLLAPATARWS